MIIYFLYSKMVSKKKYINWPKSHIHVVTVCAEIVPEANCIATKHYGKKTVAQRNHTKLVHKTNGCKEILLKRNCTA